MMWRLYAAAFELLERASPTGGRAPQVTRGWTRGELLRQLSANFPMARKCGIVRLVQELVAPGVLHRRGWRCVHAPRVAFVVGRLMRTPETVMQHFTERNVPMICRVPEPLEEGRRAEFLALVRALEFSISRHGLREVRDFPQLVHQFAGRREGGVLSLLLLRSFRPAVYATVNLVDFTMVGMPEPRRRRSS